jgi:hypothetical protein
MDATPIVAPSNNFCLMTTWYIADASHLAPLCYVHVHVHVQVGFKRNEDEEKNK